MKITALLFLSLAAASGCGPYELKIAPQVPPPSGGPKFPVKVALVVPASTRGITQTVELQNPCIGGSPAPSPEGDVFARTVEGVLRNSFQDVVSLSALPAPADAQLIVEAVMTQAAIKPACGISPTAVGAVDGTFRALSPDGHELWRSGHTSGRSAEGLEISNYDSLTPKAMASLAADWATDLAASPLASGAVSSRPAEPAAAGGEKPWWAK